MLEIQDLFFPPTQTTRTGGESTEVEIVCFDKVVAGMGSLDLGLYRDNFLQQGYFDGFMRYGKIYCFFSFYGWVVEYFFPFE